MEEEYTPYTPYTAKKKKKSDGNTLAAFGLLLGAAVGGALGLIYSRGTGEQNRKDLNLWAHHRLDDLQRKAEGVVKR